MPAKRKDHNVYQHMTFSNKFTALDSRESALLDDMRPEQRAVFEQICADYEAEFRPESEMDRDTVYCLATLRWGIHRVRTLYEALAAAFAEHSYTPPKFRLALEELKGYESELQVRYDHHFSQLLRSQRIRPNLAA
jgi:hypothetical protein